MPLSTPLIRWYRRHGRSLPWRGHPDPYAVWVSEIMLQQTRVEAVIPYFEKWMERFPSVWTLAEASEQEVLILWEGLGYYSRARNLYKAARVIVNDFDGRLPRSAAALRKLPGIGRYTAAAIASMAFGLDEPTLDGNIRRIYARLFDVDIPADSTEGEKLLWRLAAENLPKGKAGDFNQALMDLGATICLPKNPRCDNCPLKQYCQAFQLGLQESRPILKPKSEIPHKTLAAAIIVGRTLAPAHTCPGVQAPGSAGVGNPPKPAALLAQRPSKGLLANLWEFPNGQVGGEPAKTLPKILKKGYGLDVRVGKLLTTVNHAYTHFRVTAHAYQCELVSKPENRNMKWVKFSELENYPMGKVDRRIARMVVQRRDIHAAPLAK